MVITVDDDISVNYLMSGPAHLPYLVVSLHTLRRNWAGRVRIHAWDESIEFVEKIAQDKKLNITAVHHRKPALRRKDGMGGNSQFADKIQMMLSVPESCAIYFDADTIVAGVLDPLVQPLQKTKKEFVATQFNQWKTNSGVIRKRLERLSGRKGISQTILEMILRDPLPSVNGGVWACRTDTRILDAWYSATVDNRDLFIADETVLHPIIIERALFGAAEIVKDGTHNSSPKFYSIPEEDVCIWHFHGDSNIRPNKSQTGVDLWWPAYQRCLEWNIGGLADWKNDCGNHRLFKLEQQYHERA